MVGRGADAALTRRGADAAWTLVVHADSPRRVSSVRMAPVFSPLWFGVGAAVGAVAGPVVRAAIFRYAVPYDEPWRTNCPTCDTPLVRGNWRLLRSALPPSGRCRNCRQRIGPPIGVVELVGAAVVGVLAAVVGPHPVTLAFAWAALIGVALGFVDVAVHRLPDPLIITGLVGTVPLLAIAVIAGAPPKHLLTAAIGGLATGAIFFVMAFLPRGMGLGDAKLAVLTGLCAGWFGGWAALYAWVFGIVLAGPAALLLIITRRARRRDSLPIGPFMLLGALAAILLFA